jgi:hypothetical protein
MQHRRRDPGAAQPTGQFVGEQHVGQLGLVVGLLPRPGPFTLEVGEVDPAQPLRVGGHRDNPGGGAGHESVDEQVGEQERCEVVERERVLEPVGGDVPRVPEAPDVVDQDVQAGKGGEDVGGEPAHLRLGRHVRDEDLHGWSVVRLDLGGGVLGPAAVPAGDRDPCAQGGESGRGRLADAACAPGDQDGSVCHLPGHVSDLSRSPRRDETSERGLLARGRRVTRVCERSQSPPT